MVPFPVHWLRFWTFLQPESHIYLLLIHRDTIWS